MAETTKIQWCDHSWNPWRGCSKVSAGCQLCYAATMSKRNHGTLGVWGDGGTRVVAAEAQWKLPIKWDKAAAKAGKRRRVFCASLADVFEDWAGRMVDADGATLHQGKAWGVDKPWIGVNDIYVGKSVVAMDDVRSRLFALIDATPNLDWLVLTKRPQNIAKMMPPMVVPSGDNYRVSGSVGALRVDVIRKNLWLGVSCENQATADERIPHLLRVPAAVRFLSVEPLLGPIRIDARLLTPIQGTSQHGQRFIDWLIVGGESGHGSRPCNVAWIRDIVRQCKAAGVPCFVKQLGRSYFSGDNNHSHIFPRDKKGGDPFEWPEDLRVREIDDHWKAKARTALAMADAAVTIGDL